jgi:hypothetical protein
MNMYCPNCGTSAAADQQFCRACGVNLQPVSEVLAGGRFTAQVEKGLGEILEEFRSKRKRLLRWGVLLLVGSLIIGSSIPALAGLVAYGLDLAALIPLAAGLTGMVMFTGVTLVVYSSFLPKASTSGTSPKPRTLPPSLVTTELPPGRRPESVPSVTEHTTALFGVADAKPNPHDTARERE